MRNMITIPEGCEVKQYVQGQFAVTEFILNKSALKDGKWYKDDKYNIYSLYDSNRECMVGFTDGKWSEGANTRQGMVKNTLANKHEVKKLLIGEAEKKYSISSMIQSMKHKAIHGMWQVKSETRLTKEGLFFRGNLVFQTATGLWAEIVEPEKSLYTNFYDTDFYANDYAWNVDKNDLSVGRMDKPVGMLDENNCAIKEDEDWSELLKDREQCLLWIKDNIHRLR